MGAEGQCTGEPAGCVWYNTEMKFCQWKQMFWGFIFSNFPSEISQKEARFRACSLLLFLKSLLLKRSLAVAKKLGSPNGHPFEHPGLLSEVLVVFQRRQKMLNSSIFCFGGFLFCFFFGRPRVFLLVWFGFLGGAWYVCIGFFVVFLGFCYFCHFWLAAVGKNKKNHLFS